MVSVDVGKCLLRSRKDREAGNDFQSDVRSRGKSTANRAGQGQETGWGHTASPECLHC